METIETGYSYIIPFKKPTVIRLMVFRCKEKGYRNLEGAGIGAWEGCQYGNVLTIEIFRNGRVELTRPGRELGSFFGGQWKNITVQTRHGYWEGIDIGLMDINIKRDGKIVSSRRALNTTTEQEFNM